MFFALDTSWCVQAWDNSADKRNDDEINGVLTVSHLCPPSHRGRGKEGGRGEESWEGQQREEGGNGRELEEEEQLFCTHIIYCLCPFLREAD